MALVAGAAQLKAKLQLKGRWRPHAAIRKKFPDGSALLSELPKRAVGTSHQRFARTSCAHSVVTLVDVIDVNVSERARRRTRVSVTDCH